MVIEGFFDAEEMRRVQEAMVDRVKALDLSTHPGTIFSTEEQARYY